MNTRNSLEIEPSFSTKVSDQLGMSAVASGPTTRCAQPPRVRGPLCAALCRPPVVQITFRFVELKLLSVIVASESLKLSDISDGNRSDDALLSTVVMLLSTSKLLINSVKKYLKLFHFLIQLPPLCQLKQ